MGSRRGSAGFTVVWSLPWPLELALGGGVFFAIRDCVPWLLQYQGGPLAQGFNQCINAALALIAWMVLGMCCLAAFASFVSCYEARKLLVTRTTLESLAANCWRQFELLVGGVFRRQSCALEEIFLGSADSGIDLILCKDCRSTLVQCKQCKRQQMGVSVVREIYGLLAHRNARAVNIPCVCTYTKEAEQFAKDEFLRMY